MINIIRHDEILNIFSEKRFPNVILPEVVLKDGYLSNTKEVEVIAQLVKLQKVKIALEIGTFEGYTTSVIASNIDGVVYTVDLPEDDKNTTYLVDNDNLKYINIYKDKYYRDKDYEHRIKEVLLDSALLKKSDIDHNIMDFVFIDGCHNYDYVKNDTLKALSVIAYNGLIVWHDYQECWSGVIKYLNELSKTFILYNIQGTSIVIFKNDYN
jgi:predicted O-methyltransferase YrrM